MLVRTSSGLPSSKETFAVRSKRFTDEKKRSGPRAWAGRTLFSTTVIEEVEELAYSQLNVSIDTTAKTKTMARAVSTMQQQHC